MTLEAFLRYCSEQGVAQRPRTVDELVAPEIATTFRV